MTNTAPDWGHFEAVLFDLDGVLTPTADVHQVAWSRMFNEYLGAHHPDQPPYTSADYHARRAAEQIVRAEAAATPSIAATHRRLAQYHREAASMGGHLLTPDIAR